MPISSIQATIAKLSIRPPSTESEQEPSQDLVTSAAAETESPTVPVQPAQDPSPTDAAPGSLSPPLSCSSSPGKTRSPSPPNSHGNGFEGSMQASPVSNHHHPAPAAAPPASSSLGLLASLTPEAFTLDSAYRGKQRISKQSFLQPQEGQGLQGPPQGDDPLSALDPLWTLNKT